MSGKTREMTRLVRTLRKQGIEVTVGGGGHYRVDLPGGGTMFLPRSPSDYRSLRNVRAQLRREGVEL